MHSRPTVQTLVRKRAKKHRPRQARKVELDILISKSVKAHRLPDKLASRHRDGDETLDMIVPLVARDQAGAYLSQDPQQTGTGQQEPGGLRGEVLEAWTKV